MRVGKFFDPHLYNCLIFNKITAAHPQRGFTMNDISLESEFRLQCIYHQAVVAEFIGEGIAAVFLHEDI